ncbi:phage tail protein [Flavitalea antarctica]
MQSVDIYRGNGQLFASVKPDDQSGQTKAIMGANRITLSWEDSRHLEFKINDYCHVFGEKYTLVSEPYVTKLSVFHFRYQVEMVSQGELLARCNYLFLGDNNTLKETDFSLMGNAQDFMNLLVTNLQRIDTSYTLGEVIPTDYKLLTFAAENCYNALGRIAEAFNTEFWLIGTTIHLAKKQRDTGFTSKHGKGNGLYEITAQPPSDGSSVVTRLYAYGSDKNIPPEYQNFTKRLKLPGGADYIEKNTSLFGVIEFTKIFDDIYPQRTGTVSGVNLLNPFEFGDGSIDFDLNAYLIPGMSAKVTFNTGQLSGYTFDINKYEHVFKRVHINLNRDEAALEVPNNLMRPAIGDTYVFTDILMPPSYITNAETRLLAAATKLLNDISVPQKKYTVVFDPVYLRRLNRAPQIGDLIWITDSQLGLQRKIRITSTTRKIVNEFEITVEVADLITAGKIELVINGQNANTRDIIDLDKYLQTNPTLNNNVIGELRIKQGTIAFDPTGVPTTSTMTGFTQLVVENATGKVYRKV